MFIVDVFVSSTVYLLYDYCIKWESFACGEYDCKLCCIDIMFLCY